ncbi:calcofluor white hypersensitive protein-like protein [Phlyctochytrium arcticum]|nr:calcofluor white hypersensitive protein-like protein [Phlyctochytrium arcticum]
MTEGEHGRVVHQVKPIKPSIMIPATVIPIAHTILGYSAFLVALFLSYNTRWRSVLKNEVAGWPQEWFPSVSAVTGDHYPARNVFQIGIAMAAGPRFLLLALNHITHKAYSGSLSNFTLAMGLIRTLSCGGWVYITSSDQHDWHDIFMITYLVAGLFYMIGLTVMSRRTAAKTGRKTAWKARAWCITAFLATVPFLVYFFIEHKVKRVPGAYSIYALFEWSVILYDVGFDHMSVYDVKDTSIHVAAPRSSDAKTHHQETVVVPAAKPVKIVVEKNHTSDMASYIADTYLGFVFWSMLTSLGLTIWYFPLWNMGISGFEAFLFTTLSPGLLGIPLVRRIVHRFPGVFHLLSLVGLLGYRWTDPTMKLCSVGVGVGLSILTWASYLMDSDGISSERVTPRNWSTVLPFLVGLILSNVAKVYGFSNNPIWPIMHRANGGLNEYGLGLAVLACLQVLTRPMFAKHSHKKTTVAGKAAVAQVQAQGSTLHSAVGLGALLFALHSMLTDSGIICRWAVGGYPDPGVDPLTGGVIVLLCMGLGLLASRSATIAASRSWWALATAGLMALYFLPGFGKTGRYVGFAGGLVFAAYVMSIAPLILQHLKYTKAGRTLLLGTLIYDLFQLAHVWTVAYAFVPGGPLLRERTYVVVLIMQFFLLLGVTTSAKSLGLAAQREAPVPVDTSVRHEYDRTATALSFTYLLLAACVGTRMSMWRDPVPYHAADNVMTMGIWTVHFGLDDDMYGSHKRMADVIGELELDVIGLLESDTNRIIMGNRDLTQYLSETLHMYADYGPGPTKHTWGCSMLSKFPIVRSSHHQLPSPVGELACAIHATLDVYGKEVDVIVSHNGQEEDWVDRQLQTRELARIMNESQNPFVFLGYVVTQPGQYYELYKTLTESGRMNDIDPFDWDRWCQYILFRGLDRIGYARVSHGHITDTEIQVGKFMHPPSDSTTSVREWEWQNDESKIPTGWRFPAQFNPPGVRGHQYHVFNAPRYWSLKESK